MRSATTTQLRMPKRAADCNAGLLLNASDWVKSDVEIMFSPRLIRSARLPGAGFRLGSRYCRGVGSAGSVHGPRVATRLKYSPSHVASAPEVASHSRRALSRIDSNTGARLPGEVLMTCRTSAVAA